jgi:hypothetical protein
LQIEQQWAAFLISRNEEPDFEIGIPGAGGLDHRSDFFLMG